jgi:hypothetical protein
MGLFSCKKESTAPAPTPKTTQEKLLGKWNWISEVVNHYYGGMPHITTYNFPAGDYMEFKTNGTVAQSHSGTAITYGYGVIDETKIWLVVTGDIYELKVLTATDLQLYKKDVNGVDYDESTLIFKR